MFNLVFSDSRLYFMVKNTTVVAFILYLLGNSFRFGDYLIELLFKPIEKELFPCKKKQYYRSKEDLIMKKLDHGLCEIKESDANSQMN
jgi:hypothetical protein